MQPDINATEQVILLVVCGFVAAINLSLVFAFLRRNRPSDNNILSPFARARRPWHSKYEDESAELSRMAGELRKKAGNPDPGKDIQKPDHSC